MKWRRMSIKQRREAILSVYRSYREKLTAAEITARLKELGVEPPSPQELGKFMRAYMEFKHVEKVRKHNNRGHPVTYWALR